MYIQLSCMIRYVSFNIDMYVLSVGVGCLGLLCSFICCIGDRVSCMGGVCVLFVYVCVGW